MKRRIFDDLRYDMDLSKRLFNLIIFFPGMIYILCYTVVKLGDTVVLKGIETHGYLLAPVIICSIFILVFAGWWAMVFVGAWSGKMALT